jgi:hypothetical protein
LRGAAAAISGISTRAADDMSARLEDAESWLEFIGAEVTIFGA